VGDLDIWQGTVGIERTELEKVEDYNTVVIRTIDRGGLKEKMDQKV